MDRPEGRNAAIELHDSVLLSTDQDDAGLVAVLSAYVHRSEGEPGVHRGTGWSQTAALHVARGVCSPRAVLPMNLADGTLDANGSRFSNVIPAPRVFQGPIRMTLTGFDGAIVVIQGDRLEVRLEGTARFIERFEPDGP